MWTLFDPLVRPVESDSKAEQKLKLSAQEPASRAPSTLERLWLLLEPTGPLSYRWNGLDPRGN